MSGPDLLQRWRANSDPSRFTPPECAALAEFLVQRGAAIYRDPKHPDHQGLSDAVAELNQRAYPGSIGPGGEAGATGGGGSFLP